jgi:type I restriction enzyme M protein
VPKTAAEAKQLVDKLWSYCHVLRHDGVSTIDYVDQLTLLLFLKMTQERAERKSFGGRKEIVPSHLGWQTLLDADADDLKFRYENILDQLGNRPDTALGLIYHGAENKIRNAATLKRLIVDLIDKVNWSGTGVDIKGDAYEALLEKGAEDVKSGAGQYFTPRALIDAMVRCMKPQPDDTIVDPACGTGGFLLAAQEYIVENHEDLTKEEAQHFREGGISGVELVHDTARLAQMNLLLHGIGEPGGKALIDVRDALARPPGPEERATLVLANPPFGRKSGFTTVDEFGKVTREDVSYDRADFWVPTSNKQLNFVQHIANLLKIDGRAAVVVPDNVLFEGGAGETLRRRLLKDCNVHTLLRLPTGIFYAGGVKANVLFFDRKRARPEQAWTSKLWVYDFRTGQHFTLRQNKLQAHHLDEFVEPTTRTTGTTAPNPSGSSASPTRNCSPATR